MTNFELAQIIQFKIQENKEKLADLKPMTNYSQAILKAKIDTYQEIIELLLINGDKK